MNVPDVVLDTLLDLNGSIFEQEGGYWIKIKVRRIPPSEHAHHGIRYSLTLHDKYGTRVLGYDNAQAAEEIQVRRATPALRPSSPNLERQKRALCVRIGASAVGELLRRGGSRHQGSKAMKTIVIGVMPQEQIRARAIAIAKGEYTPKPGEPRIWFTSSP